MEPWWENIQIKRETEPCKDKAQLLEQTKIILLQDLTSQLNTCITKPTNA
jgi:hypothetical protein